MEKRNLIDDTWTLNLAALQDLQVRPPVFAPGEPGFWNDPYISKQLLSVHIDAASDAASRRLSIIEREVAWLVVALRLEAGETVLDLGCGPGFYAERLARHRLRVTGIDTSERSLAYARDHAREHDLSITYCAQDYLTLDVSDHFDAVILVNGDFCALDPNQRRRLLSNIHRALKPGRWFALDVLTAVHGQRYTIDNQWFVADGGFWRERKHLVLGQGFHYPEENVTLNQYAIIEPDGTITVYRNWFQHYTPASIVEELGQVGFSVEVVGGNLRGGAYTESSDWIGVIAQKPPTM
jgi:SAM-dependent methyltransferase